MSKFGLVFDSTVYLKKDILEKNNVRVASLNVVEGTESYREVDVDVPFVLKKQDSGAKLMTSQPSPGDFLEAFEELISEGKERIFVITLSKNISGTFQSANLAKSMLDDPDKVHVFDTMLAAYGTEMIAVELLEMINDGSDEKTIIERIERIISKSVQMFTVENLFSLARGGRLSSAQAMIGTVLKVKPIIKIVDGKLVLAHKERSYKKVHKYMIEAIKSSMSGNEKLTFYVVETHSPESGEMLRDELIANFPDAKLTFTRYLGPVFSIHVGKKGYGLSWFTE